MLNYRFKVISELATHALGNLPAVFILDNVHLMDKMSWKLLIQVSALCCCFRSWWKVSGRSGDVSLVGVVRACALHVPQMHGGPDTPSHPMKNSSIHIIAFAVMISMAPLNDAGVALTGIGSCCIALFVCCWF